MSRICVKNLPNYVEEDRLKEFFMQKGEVTDTKLMRKDGKSRRFAFIGFRTEQEANAAIKFFNNSYMDTMKITCEIACKVGDPNIPRPWSRHSLMRQEEMNGKNKKNADPSSLSHRSTKGEQEWSKKRTKQTNIGIKDPQLQEFLEVMQPRKTANLWSNDTVGHSDVRNKENATRDGLQSGGTKKLVPLEDGEDEEHSGDLPHSAVSDMDYLKSKIKEWSDSDSESGSDNSLPTENEGDEYHDLNTRDGIRKNVEYEVPSEGLDGEVFDHVKASSPIKNDEEQLINTRRLFVVNIPYTATEDELSDHFSKFGSVSEVQIIVHKDSKNSKGYGYVQYVLPESASRALEELHESSFQGRRLHVIPAKEKHSSEKQGSIQDSITFKQKKEEQRKASEASGDTRAWNPFLIRQSTVAKNVARNLGVRESELYDPERDNIAVGIALAETKVIEDTKKGFLDAGVNIAALEEFAAGKADASNRSNHIILVKYLPYGSSEADLAKKFGKFGSLEKIILPPTKTLALVVFLEAVEARAAFKGLCYTRYIDGPLYLEWAPANILCLRSTSKSTDAQNDIKKMTLGKHIEDILEADIDPDRVESPSLYVKNLHFKTTDEGLKEHFVKNVKQGSIRNAMVKKHLVNKKNVSKGYGFVEFDSVESAVNACRDLQGTILDGHALTLQLTHAKKPEQVVKKIDKDRSSTKLIVRNVAFEATEKDLRQLFSSFGQIKKLKLPKKFANHRGFAFVEFFTKKEAENALQALSSTHLYGRHLVLEQAKESETFEELRVRTTAQFIDEQNSSNNPTKLSKKRRYDVNQEDY